MKRFWMIIIVIVNSVWAAFAQDNYYYYQGKKMPLSFLPNLFYIALEDTVATRAMITNKELTILKDGSYIQDKEKIYWKVVKDESRYTDQLSNSKAVLYTAPVIGKTDSTYVPVSQFFHVEVKGNIKLVIEKAKELGANYKGEVPYSTGWHTFESTRNKFSIDIANRLFEMGIVEEISPDFMFNFQSFLDEMDQKLDLKSTFLCISDPQFGQQWALKNPNGIDVSACAAWSITTGSGAVKIAVVDTGVDPSHIEFSNRLSSSSFDAQSGTNPAIVYGSDHGTHVAGIIAANQNGLFISGIAPSIQIIPVSHSLNLIPNISAHLASGINWSWQNGAHVINNSWGDQGGAYYNQLQSALLESAINNALNHGRGGLGTIVVFASGNKAPVIDYPGSFTSAILTVGSINSSGSRSSSSGYGTALDIVAPGHEILSTSFGGTTVYKNGTSMAAPMVSGIAGLILSINPNLSREAVVNYLESTAKKVGNYNYATTGGRLNGTWNNHMGYGLVNAHAALLAAGGGGDVCTPVKPPTVVNGVNYSSNSSLNGCNFRFSNSNVISGASLAVNADGYVELGRNFSVTSGSSLTIQ